METQILAPTEANLKKAAALLAVSEVVAIPTETVYGLAGLALSPEALLRIYEAKERPSFDPLIVHLPPHDDPFEGLIRSQLVELSPLSSVLNQHLRKLIHTFWPGPLTLVLPKTRIVPDLATSGLPTVAVRMPFHPITQSLLKLTGPLAAPSANRFGRISPTAAEDVYAELAGRIPMILDGGRCDVGVESTILYLENPESVILLRPGGVTREAIESCLGQAITRTPGTDSANPLAPGLLASHYAPRKPLSILQGPAATLAHAPTDARTLGVLVFTGDCLEQSKLLGQRWKTQVYVQSLTSTGDLREAARNLFAALRSLDSSPAEELFAEPCPWPQGLGLAINDRIKRAATPRASES